MKNLITFVLIGVFIVVFRVDAFDANKYLTIASNREDDNVEKKFIKSKNQDQKGLGEEKKDDLQNKKMQIEERINEKEKERKERICSIVEKRISLRVKKYEQNKDRDIKIFGVIGERFDRLLAFFQKYDLDTSDLKTRLDEFDTSVEEAYQLHNQFINSLKEVEGLACDDSGDVYRETLKNSQQEMVRLKNKIIELRAYYRNVIREEILALRFQLEELTDSEDGEKEGGDENENN